MDKRALSAIPRPVFTDKNKEMLLLVPHISYLATASRQEVNGIDTLIINFFHAEERELKPAFRTFCQPDDYITQDLTTDKTKWKTGAINYLTGYLYWYRNGGNIAVASVEEREIILGFLYEFKKRHDTKDYDRCMEQGRSVTDTELEDRIDEYQDKIKEWKLQEKHNKEKAEIDLHMEKFGDVPKDYDRFVREKVFGEEHYIFYSTANKSAYCTSCELDFELDKEKHLRHKKIPIWNDVDKVKHNHTVLCPYCGKYFKCKSESMSRRSLFAVQWSVLIQKHEEDVLVRYFCHTKDFRINYRNPEITTMEKFRTVHTAEKAKDFEWARFKSTYDYRWCIFHDRKYSGWCPPAEITVPRSAVLYNENLLKTVSGTCMKYSAVDIYIDKIVNNSNWRILLNKPWTIDWYFNQYRKTPYLEQLLKIGFYKIAQSVMEDHNCPEFQNGKTVLETLGINKLQFNMLREVGNPTVRDVMILRYAKEIRQEDFKLLRYIHDDGYDKMYEKYLDMRQYTTIYKVDKYINKQRIKHDADYFDYIRWLEKMGYDMRNEFNLFPRNFRRAHDEMSKQYMKFKDKQAREDAKRFNRLLRKLRKETAEVEAMNLNIDGLFIRLPNKLEELKEEGESLHHCVGTYMEKVEKGETMIFFIRQKAAPEEPYYTLEWHGRVVQCRGFRNCEMTPEVKAFVEIFEKKMAEYEAAPKKQRKAG